MDAQRIAPVRSQLWVCWTNLSTGGGAGAGRGRRQGRASTPQGGETRQDACAPELGETTWGRARARFARSKRALR